ncbi:unnamed protein product [Macrosiphum euphorbiae]|nr:unnamed protein product [Macrosiphum euphorbiae]
MTDFEQSIINATKKIIGVEIHACLFHLCQSFYRRIQAEGLQSQYNNPENRSIKIAAQMTGALAFVPPEKVVETFDELLEKVPDDYMPIAEYFEINYIRGRQARGRRKGTEPRFPPTLWNQYHAVLQRLARTNNLSEGWHNRFQVVVGRE